MKEFQVSVVIRVSAETEEDAAATLTDIVDLVWEQPNVKSVEYDEADIEEME